MEDLLTVREAAGELGISQGSVRIAIYEGRLPCTVKYGKRLIARSDLEAYKTRTQPMGEKRTGRPLRSKSRKAREE